MIVPRTLRPLVLAVGLLAAGAASAATSNDPEWPCVQMKNPQIAAAAIWGGPELPDASKEWWKDQDVANAVLAIASRRTPMEEVEKLVDKVAASGGDKAVKLSSLFLGMLERINIERNRIMGGLGRYARKQRAFADRIEVLGDQIALLRAGKAVEGVTAADRPKLEEELKWQSRVFEERNASLQYVCESPTLLEQRAFEIARIIANKF